MRRVTAGTAWMSRAVCVMIRACGRIVGKGILTQYEACTLHEHCRSRVLDRANFCYSSCVKRPRGHHEMSAGARGKVAGAGFVFCLMETGPWLEM